MIIYPISDSHGDLPPVSELPSSEPATIIHAGDLCPDFIGALDTVIRLQQEWLDSQFRWWLSHLPEGSRFVMTPGNHCFVFESGAHREIADLPNFQCLINRGTQVDGIGWVHGTPWSFCPKGWAFHCGDEDMMNDHCHYTLPTRKIDLWVIHQPPRGPAGASFDGVQRGSETVHRWAKEKARVVVTGHIHAGYGVYEKGEGRPYLLINAALCNEENERVHEWRAVDIGEPYE